MTKFLKQKCLYEAATVDGEGNTVVDEYGDIQYDPAIVVPCRREKYARDIQTANGAIIKCSSRYFLDETVDLDVDDRLDGHVVLSCESYIDQLGVCIGYEAYV